MNEAKLMAFFAEYAYQPMYVYGFIVAFMVASGFGLPIPEELTLMSAGFVAYMAQHPELYPPPYPGAKGVDTIMLCLVCFLAVVFSDTLVYLIGKYFGGRIIKTRFLKKQVEGEGFKRINVWFQKYGGWACGIFRFTPGLRFPGHLSCGLLGIPLWKFVTIDALVAFLSVPTQVYIVATYGDVIFEKLKEFKLAVLAVLGVVLVVWLVRKVYLKNVRKNA
ncbi:MAG TPA: DedA family protein [Bacteriovoracaceae bacterium]|nr:DedA family protein [Bacteriovoracaceae bacterium]